jgi:hypothetical protein
LRKLESKEAENNTLESINQKKESNNRAQFQVDQLKAKARQALGDALFIKV